ncbi:MAG: M20/M25/M40 family metallo-hydrolase [Streptosporangiales bacterium]|nr:M20/M25/M40 family metallo-hydrolase [Streptosporangiales bacterium]
MSRDTAIAEATKYFDSGAFFTDLARKVRYRTESQDPQQEQALRAYLTDEMAPWLQRLGFEARMVENPVSSRHPLLVAHRHEGDDLPTVLTYGHGDVQMAHDEQWRAGLTPWDIVVEGDYWYGRGIADNKGQHAVNLTALDHVIRARQGKLGYNVTLLMDMGEESGSPGLAEACAQLRDELAADVFIASDGPRLSIDRPTVFLGARGVVNFTLSFRAREGSHHSGNWGGLLRNPATVVMNAVASMVDGRGRILVDELRPAGVPEPVRRALEGVTLEAGDDGPSIDDGWGEPGLTPNERVIAWNSIEVLAMIAGDPEGPVNAIPGHARATCQLRFVVDTDWRAVEGAVRRHLDAHGFEMVEVNLDHAMAATRLDPDNPWVRWTLDSLRRSAGTEPVLLPNLGGSLPNEAFADTLGLPTVWVPHSYAGCSQHAPNEHLPAGLLREGLQLMTGLFWDLAELDSWPPEGR